MKKILLVYMDEDGHFDVFDLFQERDAVLKWLKTYEGGDMWANESEEALELSDVESEEDIPNLNDDNWIFFVEEFCQRGRFEIIEKDI